MAAVCKEACTIFRCDLQINLLGEPFPMTVETLVSPMDTSPSRRLCTKNLPIQVPGQRFPVRKYSLRHKDLQQRERFGTRAT